MLPEIWTPNLTVVFVGTCVTQLADTLGFYHLHPRDRFWEMLVVGGITPKRIITEEERKALSEGQRSGNLSDPVRQMFTEKKRDQLLRLGIGFTDLNRRVVAADEKDPLGEPTQEDVRAFIGKAEELAPKILGFVMSAEVFIDAIKSRFPVVTDELGPQSFRIGGSEVWLLGSATGRPRGEALAKQEDAFFALGERMQALGGEPKKG